MSETDISPADESPAEAAEAADAVDAELPVVDVEPLAEVLDDDVDFDFDDDLGPDEDPVISAGNALVAALQAGNTGQSEAAVAAWEAATS